MSSKTAVEKYAESIERKTYLTDEEGAVYCGMSISLFRVWSKRIGARKRIGNGTRGKITNVRAIIDEHIMKGDLD